MTPHSTAGRAADPGTGRPDRGAGEPGDHPAGPAPPTISRLGIRIEPLGEDDRKPRPRDPLQLGFGRLFTDRMFSMRYDEARGWHDARIHPYRPLELDPAALGIHYAQCMFEGLKAYPRPDGGAALFRPTLNIERMSVTAARMGMPPLDPDLYLEALETLVDLEREWIPRGDGTALYIRPTMIASEAALGVRPSREYLFYIILSPVGPYFASGFRPLTLEASDRYVRAVRGGTGHVKASANYAPTVRPAADARARGCDQVLWLDAIERRYVEEMGGMNIFFVIDGKICTAPVGETILPGVTRRSVIELGGDEGLEIEERRIPIDEVLERAADGGLTEAFATGTAAVVTAVGEVVYRESRQRIGDGGPGPLTRFFHDTLTGIQYGRILDTRGWIHPVPRRVGT